jgi:hypothetical protein
MGDIWHCFLCGWKAELLLAKARSTHNNHFAFKGFVSSLFSLQLLKLSHPLINATVIVDGRSGYRIPLGARFSLPSRPVPRPTQPPVKLVPGLTWGYSGRSLGLNPHLVLVPSCELVGSIPPHSLCSCLGTSWSGLYHFYYCYNSGIMELCTDWRYDSNYGKWVRPRFWWRNDLGKELWKKYKTIQERLHVGSQGQ